MQASSPPFTIRALSYAAGVEIIGLDLRYTLPESTIEHIKDVWADHLILLFRNQPLSPDQQIAFTSRFGPLTVFDGESLEGYPQILRVTNKTINGRASGTREAGRSWHADQTFTTAPAMGSFFACKEKPPVGGDTLFANMCRAFETLTPTLQAILEGLEAVHDYSLVAGNATKDPAHVARMKQKYPPVRHRVVLAHPRTGRKALLVGDRVSHFHGMTPEESRPLLRFLVDHATSVVNTYRHQWQVDDLVVWDNRYTMHYAPPDFDTTQPRDMYRTTVNGEPIGTLLA